MAVEVAKPEKISRRTRPRARKKPKMEKPELYEVIDVEDDDKTTSFFFPNHLSQKGWTISDPISVEEYTAGKDLHLAIVASIDSSNKNNNLNFIDLTHETSDDEIQLLDKSPFFETGQSSNSKTDPSFVCEICVEPKSANESFSIKGCGHSYCTDCTAKYVAAKLQDNVTTITCPVSGCAGSLEPHHCQSIIPAEVFDRWGLALCEALFSGSERFYCPFKDCSVMLLDDGGEAVRQSECPSCYRMFCAQCKVPWHDGIGCEEFQKLNKDEREKEDIMLRNLAMSKSWKRCPNCKFYVERSAGCLYMKCRFRLVLGAELLSATTAEMFLENLAIITIVIIVSNNMLYRC
ncbi:hypothetical protein TIFTF001_022070 [Ficus carica]|uniref:RBR-type E3 ubiquitin transferase n=1 Tax=Ficus carica TaxID=3494 RepID=A0AA88AT83_FICCA|nr:hypothetical protein TIFTF001_022070 [Ficus carica]